jgi:hypothetical protein
MANKTQNNLIQGYNIYSCSRLYTNGNGQITTLNDCMNKCTLDATSVGFNYSKESVCELAFLDSSLNTSSIMHKVKTSPNSKLPKNSFTVNSNTYSENFLNTDEISLFNDNILSTNPSSITMFEETLPYHTAYLKNNLGKNVIVPTKCYNNPNYTLYSFWGPIVFIIFLFLSLLLFFLIARQQQRFIN